MGGGIFCHKRLVTVNGVTRTNGEMSKNGCVVGSVHSSTVVGCYYCYMDGCYCWLERPRLQVSVCATRRNGTVCRVCALILGLVGGFQESCSYVPFGVKSFFGCFGQQG